MYADLHVHSQYSDGTYTLKEIIVKAQAHNISLLSICDHNNIDAYLEEGNFCEGTGIKLIPGVEIHAAMDGMEYHMLAYCFDIHSKELQELLRYSSDILNSRGTALIQNMARDYHILCTEEFSQYKRNKANGGWDSLDYLKSKGLATTWVDYFSYVRNYGTTCEKDFYHPTDIIKTINNAKGYAVLAHLGDTLEQDIEKCKKTADAFINMGIDGFECYYPSHNKDVTNYLLDISRTHDMIITAGSDDHGGFNTVDGGCVYDMGLLGVEVGQISVKERRNPCKTHTSGTN